MLFVVLFSNLFIYEHNDVHAQRSALISINYRFDFSGMRKFYNNNPLSYLENQTRLFQNQISTRYNSVIYIFMNLISSVKFYHILTCDIHDYVRFQKEKNY